MGIRMARSETSGIGSGSALRPRPVSSRPITGSTMVRRTLAVLSLLALPLLLGAIRRLEGRRLTPQPRGMVLGLYAGLPDYDYADELRRIRDTGSTCVSLQAIYRMETGQANEVIRHPTSSPTEESLRRTFRQAREQGLRMMFFPTINIRDEATSATWWRGNIEPSDWELWWRNYTAFNVHLARLAQEGGVEWYSVGTEMASTHRFDAQWRRLIAEVRRVFHGKVTYSVNFDAHDTFTFGDALDVVGMNTYDPIAKHDDQPSAEAIRDGWWWIVYKARTLQARFDRKVMITEVGYPSVQGAHKGPWDFRSEKPVDLELQDRLVGGALDVLSNWGEGAAVFYYLYGEHLSERPVGGPQDRTYAVWGKPVERTLRSYLAKPIFEDRIPLQDLHRDEALVQILASYHRKLRTFEDAEMPAWVPAWEQAHPHQARAVAELLAREPMPLRKVPKGSER